MAGLQQKGGTWFCQFYELGNRYTVTAGLDRAEAETFAGGVELLLLRLKQGLLSLPTGIGIREFVSSGGTAKPAPASIPEAVTCATFV